MIKATLDLIEFFSSNFAFLFALAVYTVLSVALAKSIKKHDKVYYWIFGITSFCFIIPSVARLIGISLPFNLGSLPIIGLSASELSSAANFIHPVLVIIMYMGALSVKNKYVGRLMSIRKELSIIVGFPVLAHAVKRIFGSFPGGWQYFFDNETYMQSPRVSSALGSGITSFAFVLGLVMTILFLVLWITSFDSVHKKMGGKRWKSVQKWSYGLYAMLFLHSLCLQVGGLVSDNARMAQQASRQASVERVEAPAQERSQGAPQERSQGAPQERSQGAPQERSQGQDQQRQAPQAQASQGHGQTQAPQAQASQGHGQTQAPQAQASQGHGRPRSFSFTDNVVLSQNTKRYINIFLLLAIYGSYLYLRVRKARTNRNKRSGLAK